MLLLPFLGMGGFIRNKKKDASKQVLCGQSVPNES